MRIAASEAPQVRGDLFIGRIFSNDVSALFTKRILFLLQIYTPRLSHDF